MNSLFLGLSTSGIGDFRRFETHTGLRILRQAPSQVLPGLRPLVDAPDSAPE